MVRAKSAAGSDFRKQTNKSTTELNGELNQSRKLIPT